MLSLQENSKRNYDGIVEPPAAPRRNYDGIVETAGRNYDGIVERTPHVSSVVRDDVDFDKPYQPPRSLLGEPLTPESLNVGKMVSENLQLYPDATPTPVNLDLGQKIAHYYHERAGLDLPEPPKGYGREQGKSVTVRLRSPRSSYPGAEQIDDAVLEAMGGQSYVEAARRYRSQAGEPLGQARFNLAESFQRGEVGYDDKAGAYVFNVAPNQRFIHALNTYLQTGSVDAVREATRQIDEADEKFDKEYSEAARKAQAERGVLDAVGTGLDEVAAKGGQALHNAGAFGKGFVTRGLSRSSLDRMIAEDRKAQDLVNASERAVPEETTGANKFARGVTETVGDVATKGWMGPAFPVGVFAENLHRGPDEALRRSAPLVPMALAGSAVGHLTRNLSPGSRQLLTRGAAAGTNVAMSAMQGKTDPVDLAVDASLGAMMPVGKSEARRSASRPSLLSQVNDVVNLPRAGQTAFDDSANLRQNLMLAVGNPRRGLQALGRSIQALRSQSRADAILDQIHSDPAAVQKRQKAGLYLASDNRGDATPFLSREETYASRFARRIPGIKQSERAFTVATDYLRSHVFDDYLAKNPGASPETLKGIARFINYATGRGSLTGNRLIDGALTQAFYSPRLTVSRVQALTSAFRGTPEAKAFARKELAKYFGATAGLLGVAHAAGLVSLSPTDPDFAKIKIGNTRIDLGAGYAQLFRYMAQTATGRGISLKSGGEYEADRGETLERFVRTKLSPQASLIVNVWKGEDLRGQPTSLGKELAKLPVPLSGQDIYEAWQDSAAAGAVATPLSFFGAGVQTIVPQTEEERLQEEFARLKEKPENKSLNDVQLTHNARVGVFLKPYWREIEESGLGERAKEQMRHKVNSYFYYGRTREGDRRRVDAIERVFSERQAGFPGWFKKQLEELKGRR